MKLIEIRQKPVYKTDYTPDHKRKLSWGKGLLESLEDAFTVPYEPYNFATNYSLFKGIWSDVTHLLGTVIKDSGTHDPVINVQGKGLIMLKKFYHLMLESDSVRLTLCGCNPSNGLSGYTMSLGTNGNVTYEEFHELVEFLLTKFPDGIPNDYFNKGSEYIFADSVNKHGFTVYDSTSYEFITFDISSDEPPKSHAKCTNVDFRLQGTLKYQGDYRVIPDDISFE